MVGLFDEVWQPGVRELLSGSGGQMIGEAVEFRETAEGLQD